MSKYRNQRTRGFASKKEAKRYDELRLLEKAKQISFLRTQVRYPIKVNGTLVCTYIADFVYVGDREIVEDCKGLRLPLYQLKKKLMKAVYGIDILET